MKSIFLCSATAAILLSLAGCNAQSEPLHPPTTPSASTTNSEHGNHDHADHQHGEHGHSERDNRSDPGPSDMETMKLELAKLSAEDAASAEKQHMCPVSGDMLGLMGTPIKVDLDGQQVWICCEGCRQALLEKPAEYLAKIQKP